MMTKLELKLFLLTNYWLILLLRFFLSFFFVLVNTWVSYEFQSRVSYGYQCDALPTLEDNIFFMTLGDFVTFFGGAIRTFIDSWVDIVLKVPPIETLPVFVQTAIIPPPSKVPLTFSDELNFEERVNKLAQVLHDWGVQEELTKYFSFSTWLIIVEQVKINFPELETVRLTPKEPFIHFVYYEYPPLIFEQVAIEQFVDQTEFMLHVYFQKSFTEILGREQDSDLLGYFALVHKMYINKYK